MNKRARGRVCDVGATTDFARVPPSPSRSNRPENLRDYFAAAAEHLAESDYTGGCPLATVALEVANTNDRLRDACRRVFDSWVSDLEPLFTSSGLDEATAKMLAEHTLNSLEGAFILAKLRRDPGPLLSTGEAVALLADALLTAVPSDT